MVIQITKTAEQAKQEKQEYKDYIKAIDICPNCKCRNHEIRYNYVNLYKGHKDGNVTDCKCKKCHAEWSVADVAIEKSQPEITRNNS
jgi:hypothetical protein